MPVSLSAKEGFFIHPSRPGLPTSVSPCCPLLLILTPAPPQPGPPPLSGPHQPPVAWFRLLHLPRCFSHLNLAKPYIPFQSAARAPHLTQPPLPLTCLICFTSLSLPDMASWFLYFLVCCLSTAHPAPAPYNRSPIRPKALLASTTTMSPVPRRGPCAYTHLKNECMASHLHLEVSPPHLQEKLTPLSFAIPQPHLGNHLKKKLLGTTHMQRT